MTSRWTVTIDEEWWAEGIAAVLAGQGVVWYGYPVDESGRVGPFRSRREAERAVEEEREHVATHDS